MGGAASASASDGYSTGPCIAAAGAVTGAVLFARRVNRWGATAEELSRPLPGDDQVPDPLVASTRAVSIRAPAGAVWPWLVQMGWRRAGWYSYDRIDNDRIPSADRIMPELQELRPGDFVPEGPGVGWTVTTVEPGHLLLLTTHDPMRGVSWVLRRDSSWLFQLDDLDAGHCRLIERARTAIITNNDTVTGKLISTPPGAAALSLGDFVMAHRHMQGIRRRAEAQCAPLPGPARGLRRYDGALRAAAAAAAGGPLHHTRLQIPRRLTRPCRRSALPWNRGQVERRPYGPE